MDFMLVKYFPLITAVLWGTTYVPTKFALPEFSPMAIAAGRAFFAYLLLTALEKTRAAKASVYFFISPVIAAILAYFLLKEKIGLGTVIGGLFIIGGILITVLAKPGVEVLRNGTNLTGKHDNSGGNY